MVHGTISSTIKYEVIRKRKIRNKQSSLAI